MTRQLLGRINPSNQSCNGGIHKARITPSSARSSRSSSSGSFYSANSPSNSSLHNLESHLLLPSMPHVPDSVAKHGNETMQHLDSNHLGASESFSIETEQGKGDLTDTQGIHCKFASSNDTRQDEVIRIYPCNRRSSFLSKCMMKEHLSWRPMGLDAEGYPKFALHIDECQGFKWNKNLRRIPHPSVQSFGLEPGTNSWFEEFSDEDNYASDFSDESQENEPIIS